MSNGKAKRQTTSTLRTDSMMAGVFDALSVVPRPELSATSHNEMTPFEVLAVTKQPELKDVDGYFATVITKGADVAVITERGYEDILYKTPEPVLGKVVEVGFTALGAPLPSGTGKFVVRLIKVRYEADKIQQKAMRSFVGKVTGKPVPNVHEYATVEGRADARDGDEITSKDFDVLVRVAVTGERDGDDRVSIQDVVETRNEWSQELKRFVR